MKTQEWNPGFVPESGYPYSEPASIKMLADKYRLHPNQSSDGRIALDINEEAYPDIKMNEEKSETEDFLIFRLFEYSEALNIAEGQIIDMLHEDPFIPESMNFDVAFKNSDIHEAPVKIYINKTNQNILLFRKPGSPMEDGYNPAMYTLQMKKDDGSILSVDLMLSSKRIAYTTLWSLGVPAKSTIEFNPDVVVEEVKGIQNNKPIGITEEEIDDIAFTESLNNEKALDEEYLSRRPRPDGTIRVFFKRVTDKETIRMVVDVTADNNKEAMSKASFLLTSDEEYNFGVIEFNELSIVE